MKLDMLLTRRLSGWLAMSMLGGDRALHWRLALWVRVMVPFSLALGSPVLAAPECNVRRLHPPQRRTSSFDLNALMIMFLEPQIFLEALLFQPILQTLGLLTLLPPDMVAQLFLNQTDHRFFIVQFLAVKTLLVWFVTPLFNTCLSCLTWRPFLALWHLICNGYQIEKSLDSRSSGSWHVHKSGSS